MSLMLKFSLLLLPTALFSAPLPPIGPSSFVVKCVFGVSSDCSFLTANLTGGLDYEGSFVENQDEIFVKAFADPAAPTGNRPITGDLRASIQYSGFGGFLDPVDSMTLASVASIEDHWTVHNSRLEGTLGILEAEFEVDGYVSSGVFTFAQLDFAVLTSEGPPILRQYFFPLGSLDPHNTLPSERFTFLTTIRYGSPFFVQTALAARAELFNGSPAGGFSNFANTATLRSLKFFDAERNPVYDATLESALGIDYPVDVPEPSTALLSLAALGMLVTGHRLRWL